MKSPGRSSSFAGKIVRTVPSVAARTSSRGPAASNTNAHGVVFVHPSRTRRRASSDAIRVAMNATCGVSVPVERGV